MVSVSAVAQATRRRRCRRRRSSPTRDSPRPDPARSSPRKRSPRPATGTGDRAGRGGVRDDLLHDGELAPTRPEQVLLHERVEIAHEGRLEEVPRPLRGRRRRGAGGGRGSTVDRGGGRSRAIGVPFAFSALAEKIAASISAKRVMLFSGSSPGPKFVGGRRVISTARSNGVGSCATCASPASQLTPGSSPKRWRWVRTAFAPAGRDRGRRQVRVLEPRAGRGARHREQRDAGRRALERGDEPRDGVLHLLEVRWGGAVVRRVVEAQVDDERDVASALARERRIVAAHLPHTVRSRRVFRVDAERVHEVETGCDPPVALHAERAERVGRSSTRTARRRWRTRRWRTSPPAPCRCVPPRSGGPRWLRRSRCRAPGTSTTRPRRARTSPTARRPARSGRRSRRRTTAG